MHFLLHPFPVPKTASQPNLQHTADLVLPDPELLMYVDSHGKPSPGVASHSLIRPSYPCHFLCLLLAIQYPVLGTVHDLPTQNPHLQRAGQLRLLHSTVWPAVVSGGPNGLAEGMSARCDHEGSRATRDTDACAGCWGEQPPAPRLHPSWKSPALPCVPQGLFRASQTGPVGGGATVGAAGAYYSTGVFLLCPRCVAGFLWYPFIINPGVSK